LFFVRLGQAGIFFYFDFAPGKSGMVYEATIRGALRMEWIGLEFGFDTWERGRLLSGGLGGGFKRWLAV
jgi:hypothetical protein